MLLRTWHNGELGGQPERGVWGAPQPANVARERNSQPARAQHTGDPRGRPMARLGRRPGSVTADHEAAQVSQPTSDVV
jgi:hypothetical protein